MTTLIHRNILAKDLNALIDESPSSVAALNDDHRRSLSARFRAVPGNEHRRLDAWVVEQAGQVTGNFRWSPRTARRTIGNGALRRVHSNQRGNVVEAVREEITDQLLRAASGYAQRGSMASWLSSLAPSELGLVVAEATNWAVQLHELALTFASPWNMSASDAFYDVARARTTLRGRRDLDVKLDERHVVVRVRSGVPGKSAGPGLRSDLTIITLAHPEGVAPNRLVGVWPEAGVCLGVDGTMADLRAGARDLVRSAVAQQRQRVHVAA